MYFSLHQFHSTFVMSFIARMLANILFTCTWHLIGLIVPTYDDWLVFHCPCCQCPSFASVSSSPHKFHLLVGAYYFHWVILYTALHRIWRFFILHLYPQWVSVSIADGYCMPFFTLAHCRLLIWSMTFSVHSRLIITKYYPDHFPLHFVAWCR